MKKIKAFFKRLFGKLNGWIAKFMTVNDEAVKKYSPIAVDICNFIKEYNGNAIVDDLTKFLSSLGNPVVDGGISIAKKVLSDESMDKVLSVIGIATKTVEGNTPLQKVQIITDYIKSIEGDSKKKEAWTTLASIIAEILSNGTVTWKELYLIVEGIYKKNLNKSA